MARTNIDLDERLVSQAMKLTGAHTKKEIVHRALSDLVRRQARKGILKLEGKIHWEGDLAQMRKARFGSRRYKRMVRFSDR